MIPLDHSNREFQAFIAKELNLTDKAVFTSCKIFAGSVISDHCIGIVKDRDTVTILITGSFEISGNAIVLYLDFPGAPDPRVARQEIDKVGLRPETTRFVGVCVRKPLKRGEIAEGPEMQVVFIPY